ncbi:MAG: hypothetical protein KDK36_11055, partial [Leptospiraceae bacterium]|nr:hypothetical protein [Leptospiraceae bacterium]
YTITGGTATGVIDYTSTSGTLIFTNGGALTQNISITINNDAFYENDETIILTLSNPSGGLNLGVNSTHTYTITNNDSAPTLAFDATSSNGSESIGTVNIPVSLNTASNLSASINYSVTGGTAVGGGVDYTLASGTLNFNPGDTTKNITLTVNNDLVDEPAETIIITLDTPVGATLGTNTTHTYTINDDDLAPNVAFDSATSIGLESVTSISVPVSLSSVSAQVATVDYSVTGGSATSGTDYNFSSGTLTFPAGTITQYISFAVTDDSLFEDDETIEITLSNGGNATVAGTATHTYTITNNDATPSISFSSASSSGSESITSVTIPVTLSAPAGKTLTVDYSVLGSSTATGGGTDYTLSNGTLTFTAGSTSQNISLTINDDSTTELNETVIIALANVTGGASLGTNTQHTYTIIDNDAPTVQFSSSSGNGAESTTTVNIPVSLSGAYGQIVTVNYSVTGGTATGSGTDYTLSSGTLTFNPGTTSKDITVNVIDDSLDESDETIIITLDTPTNSSLGTNTIHTYTINDNDNPPVVSFASFTSNSVDETSENRFIELTLSEASGQVVTVAVTDLLTGTATSGIDYTAISSSISFTPGTTTAYITVAVISDTLFEGNETINLTISSPTNATLGTTTAHTFTIIDDEIGLTAAETMDCDNDGKIEHYKLTFSANVTDSSFPGYSANSLGATTTDWLVAGYTGVALRHGTSLSAYCSGITDIVDDNILYISFNESGGFDTGAKPDITTSSTPKLTGPSGSVGQVFTASVTEADKAKPIIVSATGNTSSGNLTVTFSEVVYGGINSPACGSGGELATGSITYTNSNAGGATSIVSMGTDFCATDTNAIFIADSSFSTGDGDGGVDDTIAASINLYDAANNSGNTTPKPISITAGNPTITSIELYDPSGIGKITQFKVSFSGTMNDLTIGDSDASGFNLGGNTAVKVDSATGGTGSITSPNNDPGVANDNYITVFTDGSISGTELKSISFTTISGKWQSSSGYDLLSVSDLNTVTVDKAPPIIQSAVASYNNSNLTVDSGDTLTITFSEPTNKAITTANLSSILTLSNGHVWGGVSSADWNANGNVLTITFSGSGSTIAVNDYITIQNTLADTATSPNISTNKISVSPITGSFGLDVTKPYVVYASDITTNSVVVQFSEAMTSGSGTVSTNIDNISNYSIVEDPSNSGCTDITLIGGTLTKLSDSQVKITLPSGSNFCNTNYKVSVATTVTDLAGNTLGSPNYITFVGLEAIKVISTQAISTNSVKITFSKPPLTGNNVSYSAECNTTTECAKRYKIRPQIGDGTITSAIVNGGSDSYTVTLTHNGTQTGSAYTLMVANGLSGDNFDNTSTECVKDILSSNCVQAEPGDRGTFIGAGTSCTTLSCGSFFDDPFVDGTTFSFAFKYDNKIYLGTNDKNDAAFRFDPLGTNSILTTFKFTNNSSQTLACPNSIRFGYIVNSNLSDVSACSVNSGPNLEVGAVGFTSIDLVVGGTNYEILGVGVLKNSVDRIYYSQDKDSVLDMKSFGITGGNGVNTKSAQVMYGINDKVFVGIASDHTPNAPVFNMASVTDSSGVLTVGSTLTNLNGNNIPKIGKANGNSYTGTVGIDFIYRVGNSTYLANNGGVVYIPTSTITTPASRNKSQWDGVTTISTPSHTDFTGTSLRMPDPNSTTGGGLGKVRPGEKAFPFLLNYNGKLYLARNVGTVADSKVSLKGELWTCTPNGDGQCAQIDWTRIISGTESDLGSDKKAIGMLIANGNNLYIGYDDTNSSGSGLRVFRFSGTTPSATSGTMSSAGWIQQGVDGLGSSSDYIINSASVYDTATQKNYLYIVIGDGLGYSSIKVVRQID